MIGVSDCDLCFNMKRDYTKLLAFMRDMPNKHQHFFV